MAAVRMVLPMEVLSQSAQDFIEDVALPRFAVKRLAEFLSQSAQDFIEEATVPAARASTVIPEPISSGLH